MAHGQQPPGWLSSEAQPEQAGAIPAPFQFLLEHLSEKQHWIRQQKASQVRRSKEGSSKPCNMRLP